MEAQRKMEVFIFNIPPRAKPRMTVGDRANYRPIVKNYWKWKEALLLLAGQQRFTLGNKVAIAFYVEMPKSWSKKKRDKMENTPHKVRPDLDNFLKAVFDCLAVGDDAYIHEIHANKLYSSKPRIEIINL